MIHTIIFCPSKLEFQELTQPSKRRRASEKYMDTSYTVCNDLNTLKAKSGIIVSEVELNPTHSILGVEQLKRKSPIIEFEEQNKQPHSTKRILGDF